MQKINFTKMVASGNDFVVIESALESKIKNPHILAKKICDRKFAVGADGLLILESSKIADVRMRIFNSDGSEAQMCGNGARCTALYIAKNKARIQARAGIVDSRVNGNIVKIKLTTPKDIRLDLPIKIDNRLLRVNFINTGVPHAVLFVEGLPKIDVKYLGRMLRYHNKFAPAGTNADFVEVVNKNSISIRTYERGVEDETLACGTGTVASALIFALKTDTASKKIKVATQSGETLTVYFTRIGRRFDDVWLEGRVSVVFKGWILY